MIKDVELGISTQMMFGIGYNRQIGSISLFIGPVSIIWYMA